MIYESKTSEYWKSPEGIDRRVSMLSEDFSFNVINGALQVYGGRNNVWGFEVEGPIDRVTCNDCDALIGHQFRLGMFLPLLPAHNGCRHTWRIIEKNGD